MCDPVREGYVCVIKGPFDECFVVDPDELLNCVRGDYGLGLSHPHHVIL